MFKGRDMKFGAGLGHYAGVLPERKEAFWVTFTQVDESTTNNNTHGVSFRVCNVLKRDHHSNPLMVRLDGSQRLHVGKPCITLFNDDGKCMTSFSQLVRSSYMHFDRLQIPIANVISGGVPGNLQNEAEKFLPIGNSVMSRGTWSADLKGRNE
ncbi:hypothetical protein VNO77_07294 [Canavalia gladiata]|uniref:Uncharacterized protein n=1 Tax=Canavalia gladiata TaxID=3824 RepID=A0AAN9M7H3_CANGL